MLKKRRVPWLREVEVGSTRVQIRLEEAVAVGKGLNGF